MPSTPMCTPKVYSMFFNNQEMVSQGISVVVGSCSTMLLLHHANVTITIVVVVSRYVFSIHSSKQLENKNKQVLICEVSNLYPFPYMNLCRAIHLYEGYSSLNIQTAH